MRVGPNKEQFIKLFEKAEGDYNAINTMLEDIGEPKLSLRTFQRRRTDWITGSSPSKAAGKNPKQPAEDTRPIAAGTIHSPHKRRGALEGKRFIFTSAQNNTFVHDAFWENLLEFADYREAQVVVGKFRYNKSGFQNSSKDNEAGLWYDPRVLPYVREESLKVESALAGLVWCGDLDILPTAATPMSGLDNYTHTDSSIIPHAKVQLQSIPVLKGENIKMMYTTGACTQRNYIPRKAGQKAEFHHVFGALFVEIDDNGDFFARQIIADSSGSFYDLTDFFSNGEVGTGNSVEAINWGDIHAEMTNEEVAQHGWLRDDSMLNTLRPAHQFVHDLTDFKARNHHNLRNPHFLAARYFKSEDSVEEGMEMAAEVLVDLEREFCKTVVVESNHDQAFCRWLAEADITQDPVNAEYFHKSNAEVYKRIRLGVPFHAFEWAIRAQRRLDRTVFLDEDESYVIGGLNGIECGMHGHRGPNGSRGNPNSLRKLGKKCNIGHTHSAAIIDGIYVAGMSCEMDMGYNKGPSSWSHSHIITYPNGKRTIITMRNGKWRA